jgi:hypothetical protein
MSIISKQTGYSNDSNLLYAILKEVDDICKALGPTPTTTTTTTATIVYIGDWYLINDYIPAPNQGEITFPNYNTGTGSLNPNLIGDGNIVLYINPLASNGHDYTDDFSNYLIEKNNTLILKQGSNFVEFTITNQCIHSCFGAIAYDFIACGSPVNSITLVNPASGDFNTVDPIQIYFSRTV